MTTQEVKIEIAYWTKEVADLTKAMSQKLSGASSASISSGGGSKSYSNYSVSDFRAAIADAKRNVKAWRRKLDGLTGTALMPRQVTIVRPRY